MHANHEIALAKIAEILGLSPHAAPSAIVAKVRETKAAADLAGAAIKARRTFKPRHPMDLGRVKG